MCASTSQVTNFGSLNFEVCHETHVLGRTCTHAFPRSSSPTSRLEHATTFSV